MRDEPTRAFDGLLAEVTHRLESERELRFAVAGGLAASLYRREIRATQDIDLAFSAGAAPERRAKSLIESMSLKATYLRRADLEGGPMFSIKRRSSPVAIVAGRDAEHPDGIGLDLLLPALAWVPVALDRAAHHRVDYGFGPVPTLTLEDLLLSKLAVLRNRADRFKDLDDLQSIFEGGPQLDLAYLAGRMHELELTLPKVLAPYAPEPLLKLSRAVAKEIRRKRLKGRRPVR